MQETWVWSLGWEDPLEEGLATHSSILAWRIPLERGSWQTAVRGVAKNWTRLSNLTQHSMNISRWLRGEGNGNLLQCSCLENSRVGGAWWAAIYGVAQSRTRLKRLSSSSSSGKEFPCQWRRLRFDPWIRKISRRRKRQPTPVFLTGESHGQRSLEGYSSWGGQSDRDHWAQAHRSMINKITNTIKAWQVCT